MNAREENPKSKTGPKAKRSLLRFSLRTMMIVITLLCLFLGWKANQAVRQRRTVEEIKNRRQSRRYEEGP